ncbi:hypothetical protein E3N88_32568 [Mikania micrantha]|nr:hypothetical protein E3N88_32568 [Mikania micrantha]
MAIPSISSWIKDLGICSVATVDGEGWRRVEKGGGRRSVVAKPMGRKRDDGDLLLEADGKQRDLVFYVVAVESVGRQVPITFLERIKDDFNKKYSECEALTAAPKSLSKSFG